MAKESRQKKPPKSSATRAESVKAWQASRSAEDKRASAVLAAQKRAENRAARKVEEERKAAAKAKELATKRQRYPERYKAPPPPPEPVRLSKRTGKPIDPKRSAAGRKAAETRRANEEKRRQLGELLKEGARKATADWSSQMIYAIAPGVGSIGQWIHELFATLEADAQAAGANPYANPWRVQGYVEGAEKGSGPFDVVVDGTKHQRAEAIRGAMVAAGEKGAVFGKMDYAARRGPPAGGGGRPSKPMNATAESERQKAVAKYVEQGDTERQPMRIETVVAPPWSAVWKGIVPEENEEDDDDEGEGFDDDGDDVPF